MLNQMARLLFLQRNYQEALAVLERVARIDPEDLQMHYTAMLCYRGLGNVEKAQYEEALFERFKADEDSQVITAGIRRTSPEVNNERQTIHEHESVDLALASAESSGSKPAGSEAGGQP
jgi:tetratricopeptide (TPR) repeat protein